MKIEPLNNAVRINGKWRGGSLHITYKHGVLTVIPEIEHNTYVVEWEAVGRDGEMTRWHEVVVMGYWDDPDKVFESMHSWLTSVELIGYVRLDEVSITEMES